MSCKLNSETSPVLTLYNESNCTQNSSTQDNTQCNSQCTSMPSSTTPCPLCGKFYRGHGIKIHIARAHPEKHRIAVVERQPNWQNRKHSSNEHNDTTLIVSPDIILEKSPVRQTLHKFFSRQLNQYQEMSHWKAEFENITTEEDFYSKVDNFSQFLANAITLLPGPKHPARKYYEARQDKSLLNNQRSYEQSSNPECATKRDREKRRSKYMYQLTQFQYFNQRRKAVHSVLRQNNQRCTINVNKVHNSSKNFFIPNNCIRPSYEHVSDTDDLTPTEMFSTTITKEEIVAAANKIAVDTSP
ncbi:hypothetical protein ANN_22717 [Periplaneta americana]|uniref:C2H2-type domain-containing protein n=1 Tax=Periplaneta americana TaxID=6978 RepID=A0ABQ8S9D4_PERAM|nr:hypothetical protein ANN_22717 [Periplaneta americana]